MYDRWVGDTITQGKIEAAGAAGIATGVALPIAAAPVAAPLAEVVVVESGGLSGITATARGLLSKAGHSVYAATIAPLVGLAKSAWEVAKGGMPAVYANGQSIVHNVTQIAELADEYGVAVPRPHVSVVGLIDNVEGTVGKKLGARATETANIVKEELKDVVGDQSSHFDMMRAVADAEKAFGRLPSNSGTGSKVTGTTANGPLVSSGYATDEEISIVKDVMEKSAQGGMSLRRSGPRDVGVPGSYQASHFEKKQSIMSPNEPMAVNAPMCGTKSASTPAMHTVDVRVEQNQLNHPQVVRDSEALRTFYPGGHVETRPVDVDYVQTKHWGSDDFME